MDIILLAFALTVLSTAIHQISEFAIHFGFPTPFFTYYLLLSTNESTLTWQQLYLNWNFNPLQLLVNFVMYLLLLFVITRIWRRYA